MHLKLSQCCSWQRFGFKIAPSSTWKRWFRRDQSLRRRPPAAKVGCF